MYTYVAIITGPKEYLKEESRMEKIFISREDIEACREEGESEEETIEYILGEYQAEWEQLWCKVLFFKEK